MTGTSLIMLLLHDQVGCHQLLIIPNLVVAFDFGVGDDLAEYLVEVYAESLRAGVGGT